jgi:hypothetical protein
MTGQSFIPHLYRYECAYHCAVTHWLAREEFVPGKSIIKCTAFIYALRELTSLQIKLGVKRNFMYALNKNIDDEYCLLRYSAA